MFGNKNDPKPDPADGRSASEAKWDATDNPVDKPTKAPEFGRDGDRPTLAEEIQGADTPDTLRDSAYGRDTAGDAAYNRDTASDSAYGRDSVYNRDTAGDSAYGDTAYDDRSATQVRHDGVGPTDYSDDSTRSFAAARNDDLSTEQRDAAAIGAYGASDGGRRDYVDPNGTATLGATAATTTYGTDADPYDASSSRYDAHPEERFATGAVPPRDGDGYGVTERDEEPGIPKQGFYIPKLGGMLLGLMRILIGWKLLWDFLDKTFGLGFATPKSQAWVNGGKPTEGFLSSVVKDPNNPFTSVFQYFLDQSWTDLAFMLGLLGIGVVLILGLGKIMTWIAALSGIAMMALLYMATWPPGHSAGAVGSDGQAANNPFFDIHIFIAVALLVIAVCNASAYIGIAKAWHIRRVYKD